VSAPLRWLQPLPPHEVRRGRMSRAARELRARGVAAALRQALAMPRLSHGSICRQGGSMVLGKTEPQTEALRTPRRQDQNPERGCDPPVHVRLRNPAAAGLPRGGVQP
jgi:hypothetical protein